MRSWLWRHDFQSKTQRIISEYNTLGQLVSYTDADGNTTSYEYEGEKDTRLKHLNDGKGTQTYNYDETTGELKELTDSAAGTFTAGYDIEGNMTSEGYPNAMTAATTYNSVGEATGLEYTKTAHCKNTCPEIWFKDTAVPSIHGQWLSQTSSLSHENYSYDAAGRLIQVQEEAPSGGECTTRIYGYDIETNRTSLTTRKPNSEGKCASEGGTTGRHTYDEANRLTDEGTNYDSFGDITTLSANDAGEHELTSTYYTDGQTATLTQNGQTLSYEPDPTGRTREIVATGTTNQTTTNHYTGEGNGPAWTIEPISGHTTRNIQGPNGLAAIQTNSETPILQLTDLQGNIVATAALNETETKLLHSEKTTEYGVPTTTSPPKYSWLGAKQEPTELPSGAVAMGSLSRAGIHGGWVSSFSLS